jgi:hypothetical protein
MGKVRFRVWDGKKMVLLTESGCLYPTYFLSQHGKVYYWVHTGMKVAEDAIVMLSTGLKDTDGKDIFEGDILRDDQDYMATVAWDDTKQAWGVQMGQFTETYTLVDFCEIEIWVIGNVHQNPGLVGGDSE